MKMLSAKEAREVTNENAGEKAAAAHLAYDLSNAQSAISATAICGGSEANIPPPSPSRATALIDALQADGFQAVYSQLTHNIKIRW